MSYAAPITYLMPAEPKETNWRENEVAIQFEEIDLARSLWALTWKLMNGEITQADHKADLADLYDIARERLDDAKARGHYRD